MRTWALIVVWGLGLAGTARADFYVEAEALGEVVQTGGVFGISDLFDHDSFADSFPDAAGTQTAQGNLGIGAGNASSAATAKFGLLTTTAGASCGEDPDLFPDASATGRATSVVHDTLHVQSPTLPAGSPVELHVDLSLTTNYSSPSRDPDGFYFASAFASFDANTTSGGLHLEFSDEDPAAAVLAGTFEAQVGHDVSLDYRADAHPFVAAKGSASSLQSAVASRVRITIDTPDATAVADSGHDYGQLVPEAPAWDVELAAAATLALVARRSRA